MNQILKYPLTCLVLLTCLSLAAIGSGSLDFFQEDLEFRLDGRTFRLSGDYWFCNNTHEDITRQLYFPILSDSLAAPADKIRLKLVKPLRGQKAKLLSTGKQGFWFEVSLPAQTIAICHIAYRQRLYGNTARYVLMSTHSWGKPLEYAKYTLIIPSGLKVENLSLPSPAVHLVKGKSHYRWEYLNFLPQADFSVQFTKN
jgi:hypothetical protein